METDDLIRSNIERDLLFRMRGITSKHPKGSVVGRPSCLPSCLLGWCWIVQLWRACSGQAAASPSLACRRPRAQQMSPSNESKRGVNPTHTEPQPDTAGGKHYREETAHGETHPPTGRVVCVRPEDFDMLGKIMNVCWTNLGCSVAYSIYSIG